MHEMQLWRLCHEFVCSCGLPFIYFLWTPQSPPLLWSMHRSRRPFLGCSKTTCGMFVMRTRHRICLRKWHIRAVCDRWWRARPELRFSLDPGTDYRWRPTDNLRSRVSIWDPMRACNTGHTPTLTSFKEHSFSCTQSHSVLGNYRNVYILSPRTR
ncbi:hypothetical protein BKA83DRAFT_325508 [Pisolithus microcarpus]|nr:hypothetical protein BKA83DRAFT_325508 [Pisolithus microcarpus]